MPVQVIRGHVEHRRRERPQALGRLHLEARDLEHPGVDSRVRVCGKQVERGRSEVAAGRRGEALCFEHLRRERRDGALAVRAGHGEHRRARGARIAREQLDVADHVDPAPARFGRERDVQPKPRRQQHAAARRRASARRASRARLRRLEPRRADRRGRVAPCGCRSRALVRRARRDNARPTHRSHRSRRSGFLRLTLPPLHPCAIAPADLLALEFVSTPPLRMIALPTSADLQARQADQHQDHGDDPETHDHLRLGPALELEMVM